MVFKIKVDLHWHKKEDINILVLCCVWRRKFYFGRKTSRLIWVRHGKSPGARPQEA